ncbi:MAG: ACT domain-containing protein [Kiloniellales bacterium]
MKAPKRLTLCVLPDRLAVCRLVPDAALPPWLAWDGGLVSVTRTADELSIVCAEDRVPEAVQAERGWRALKVLGPLDFALTGILAGLAAPLAGAGISIFALSTYDTDYILVRAADLEQALIVLRQSCDLAEP